MRAGIVAAAAKLFARAGFEKTTIADVAAEAGTSVGNVYKYFANKDDLFATVVPESFVADLRRMTRARIDAVGDVRDVRKIPRGARYHVLAGELLDHCIANRERIVILLGRSEGTPLAGFVPDFADRLTAWLFDYAKRAWPEIKPSRTLRFTVRRVYADFIAEIAEAFMTFREEAEIREAVFFLTAHHQGGLLGLFESAAHRSTS